MLGKEVLTEYDKLHWRRGMNRYLLYMESVRQLERQLCNLFVDVDMDVIERKVDLAWERCIKAISVSNNKYLNFIGGGEQRLLNHSGFWSIFLYYLSNSLKDYPNEAGKVYYLNKILHSIDWFYEINLPDHFMVEHPLGSVLGRAKYGDYLLIYQGVTIGGNISLSNTVEIAYPVIGECVTFLSNAKVLGNAHIGKNVIFAANSYVINEDIPDDSIVFGVSPNLTIKHEPEKIKTYIEGIWKI